MNEIRIGDCRDTMHEWIAGGVRAQMCVTSPPYWGLRDYGVDGQLGLEPTIGEYVANMVEVFRLVRELLADDGTLWLNLGDSYAAKSLCGIPWRVAFALQADGWYLRSDIIWHKPNPMPESITDRPTKSHEYMFLLSKSERYYYDIDAIKEPTRYPGRIMDRTKPTQKGNQADPNWFRTRPRWRVTVDPDMRNRRTVWTVPSEPYTDAHFAIFPQALIEPCILAGSRAGDIVLDPFMGSGTTAKVAQRLGRQYLGCEVNPDYAPLQSERTRDTIGMVF